MAYTADDAYWNDLIRRINFHKVIPVVGPGGITCGPADAALYPSLTAELARQRGLDVHADESASLADLVSLLHERSSGASDFSAKRQSLQWDLQAYFQEKNLEPGQSLRLLARIPRLRFFLSASGDDLLARAVDLEWGLSTERSELGPTDDLPACFEHLEHPYVYPLYGCFKLGGSVALGHDDVFEFLLEFYKRLPSSAKMQNSLKNANLLFLGLDRPDWLARLLARIADGERLAGRFAVDGIHPLYLTDRLKGQRPRRIIAFFDPHSDLLKVVSMHPTEFIAKLYEKWVSHPTSQIFLKQDSGETTPSRPFAPPQPAQFGCIFISYATPDYDAAKRVAEQLERAGGFVWIDRERLKPGCHWNKHLQEAVQKYCGVFLSLISKNTEVKVEAWYLKERNLAIERYEGFTQKMPFYFPVRIDDGETIPEAEPARVKEFQLTKANGGVLNAELVSDLVETQKAYCEAQGIPLPVRAA